MDTRESSTSSPAHASPAPVALFAYKRADHLRMAVESLRRNPEAPATPLYVYCDGARRPQDEPEVAAVRDYVSRIDGFAAVVPVFRPHNLGLARSIIGGVGEVLARHGRVIVVEDDLLLSPHFLHYMNRGLDCYADDEAVASIHGYRYPSAAALPDTFFIRGADCWGWATWSRAWAHFEPDGQRLLDQLRARGLSRAFDFDGSFPYTGMLEDQVAGRNDSWAVRWYASCFLRGMLTLYPGQTLVENTGNDASGTHCAASDAFSQPLASAAPRVVRLPLEESVLARREFVRFFRRQQPSAAARAGRFFKSLLQKVA